MTNTALNIQGMTCGGCVKSVTAALQREAGVNRVEVSLEQGVAKVEHDAALVSAAQLAAAVEDAGFEVQVAG